MKAILTLSALLAVGSVAGCAAETEETSVVTPCAATASPRRIAVNGVQLNGIQLNGTSLAGGTTGLSLRRLENDPAHPDVAFYELTHDGHNVCEGGGKGVIVPGVWDATGARHDSSDVQTFACESGVIAKCVLWGYAPSRVGAEAHQACTRMARADYGGNGISYTREGTAIDVLDSSGAQSYASFAFEAGWNANGAVCASRTRYEGPQPSCLRDLPKCSSLEDAKALGATVANASRLQSHGLCE